MSEPDCALCGLPRDEHHYNGAAYGKCGEFVPQDERRTPTQEAYDAACKALWHWRDEAARLGKIAGVKPREMKR